MFLNSCVFAKDAELFDADPECEHECGPTWRWYEGYEKKYTPVQQVVTLLNPKRWVGWFKRR